MIIVVKVIAKICSECGFRSIYYSYGYSKKDTPTHDEPCNTCGGVMRDVLPGESGKIKIVTMAKCPVCDLSFPVSRKVDRKTIVCKHCGYKEG